MSSGEPERLSEGQRLRAHQRYDTWEVIRSRSTHRSNGHRSLYPQENRLVSRSRYNTKVISILLSRSLQHTGSSAAQVLVVVVVVVVPHE